MLHTTVTGTITSLQLSVYNAADCSYNIPPTILTCYTPALLLQYHTTQLLRTNFPRGVSMSLCIRMLARQPGDESLLMSERLEAEKKSHPLTGLSQRQLRRQSLNRGFVRRIF